MSFTSLSLTEPILKALQDEGYSTPTPIQAQAIPHVLAGSDLLGCAQTGTGKTAAFSIPILQLLSQTKSNDKKRKIRSLIVTPTRELAIQIGESLTAYGRYTGLVNTVIFGGVGQNPQTQVLQRGVDILVATPGRLLDLMNQGFIKLHDIEIFVLDEADRMLDMGFIHDVKKLLTVLPKKKQSLFFSATMPAEIVKLADSILVNPSKVEVTPVSSTAETIQQFMYFVDRENKNMLLLEVLKDKKIAPVLVFTRTKHGADKIVKVLERNKIQSAAIHGNKSQNARQRALSDFKNGLLRVLVATDIAARGIDVDDLQYVINFDIPNIPETYVHRIGRSGRAGAKGTAFSFCDSGEKGYLRDIEKLIAKKIPVLENEAYPMKLNNELPPEEKQGKKGNSSRRPSNQGPRKTTEVKQTSQPSKSGATTPKQGDGKPKKKRWFGKNRNNNS